jgi:hypothetical protein
MEYFTDDDIQFLRDNFTEGHARAAQWFADGAAGYNQPALTDDKDGYAARARTAYNAAGAQATGTTPDEYDRTIVDAIFVISVRNIARDTHGQAYYDDMMRWRDAPDADKPAIDAEIQAKYPSSHSDQVRQQARDARDG